MHIMKRFNLIIDTSHYLGSHCKNKKHAHDFCDRILAGGVNVMQRKSAESHHSFRRFEETPFLIVSSQQICQNPRLALTQCGGAVE